MPSPGSAPSRLSATTRRAIRPGMRRAQGGRRSPAGGWQQESRARRRHRAPRARATRRQDGDDVSRDASGCELRVEPIGQRRRRGNGRARLNRANAHSDSRATIRAPAVVDTSRVNSDCGACPPTATDNADSTVVSVLARFPCYPWLGFPVLPVALITRSSSPAERRQPSATSAPRDLDSTDAHRPL